MRLPFIAVLCIAVLGFGALQAQQLTVKSATAKAVDLEWTGALPAASLERSSGPTFQRVAAGAAGHYIDQAVEPFGIYKYRVNTNGKFSNVVTVGPPPDGVTNAAPAPKGGVPEHYGPSSSVALDENGDPVIAFEWYDPNGDGDSSDTEIRFVRWDRTSYKWLPAVRILVTGELNDGNENPFAIACDRDTGTLAVLSQKGDDFIYALSTDHGATWTTSSAPKSAGAVRATSLAIHSGQVHAAAIGSDGTFYFTGSMSDVSSWKAQAVPTGTGWTIRPTNIPVALDASGKPAIAFFENQTDGDQHRYVFWRPGNADPVAVVTTNQSTDYPNAALTFGKDKFGVLFAIGLDPKDSDHGVWYTQSSDGTSWPAAAKLPIDGPRSTNPPLDVAINSKGAVTAVFGSNTGSADATCNLPAVSRSGDGTNWKTCGLGKAAGARFSPQPPTLHVVESGNDKAYIVWPEPSDTKYGAGILVWHGR
ncbi:MAG TPA: hypothetical protein VHU83_05620 [Bryobacteraceae bacterium]|jgi:hypothetical protein|nr:hypothetical protein [Bryobacteraceae bacterium]